MSDNKNKFINEIEELNDEKIIYTINIVHLVHDRPGEI